MAGTDLTITTRRVGRRRVSSASYSSLYDETSPLILANENSLPKYGIEESALEDEENTSQQDANSVSSIETIESASTSPRTVILVFIVGVFLAQLDSSFVMATHSNIASEFGQLESSSWLVASYSLAMCAVQPCYGKISNIYGRKQCLIVAYVLFAIGSLICGLGTSLGSIILGRVVTGIGGAGTNALVSLIILDIAPLREVASLRSYINIAATTGRSLGGPIGGALADSIGWRWSFTLQFPLLLIAALLAFLFIPSTSQDNDESPSSKVSRIDFAGATLLAISITSLMVAVELMGKRYVWNHPLILGLITSSIATGILFAFVEKHWAAEPVFPLYLLGKRDIVSCYMVSLLQRAAQFGMMFCVPLYFQVTQNAPASVAGAHLSPAVIGNAFGALIAGVIIKRTGRTKVLTLLATVSASICYTLLIIRWRGNTAIYESLYIFPGGFGSGMAEASVFISLSAGVDRSIQAIALAGLFLAGNIGQLSGLAASSVVLRTSLTSELQDRLSDVDDKAEIIRNSVSDIGYVMNLTGRVKKIVVTSYVLALEYTHVVSLICSVTGFFFALIAPQRRISAS